MESSRKGGAYWLYCPKIFFQNTDKKAVKPSTEKNRNLTRFTSDSNTNLSFEDTENNPNTDRDNDAGTD